MPQPATHYWVVRRAIPQYDAEKRINFWETWWDRYKSYFGLGTAAPDLFYFPLMPGVEVSCDDFYWDGIADIIHHSRSYDVFCKLLNYAKKVKLTSVNDANKLFAFAFGYYCHVITDCIFHPYVYRSTGDYWGKKVYDELGDGVEFKKELSHKYQEFLIDNGIYNKFNIQEFTTLERISWQCSNESGDKLEPLIANCFYNVLVRTYPDCFPNNYKDPNDINHPIQQAYLALEQTADLLFKGKEIFLFGAKRRIPTDKIQEYLPVVKEFFTDDKSFFTVPYPNCCSLDAYSPEELFNCSCAVARKIFIESLKYWQDDNAIDSKKFFEEKYTHFINQGNWNLDTGLKCNCNNLEMLHKDNKAIDIVGFEELKQNYIVFNSDYKELFEK